MGEPLDLYRAAGRRRPDSGRLPDQPIDCRTDARLSTLDLAQRRVILDEPYDFAALVIMGTTFIVGVFYCLDALHGERRDRSILFWKSLPVSDLTTVLSKASIPLVVLPLLTFAITVVTQLIMLLLSSAVLLGSGLSVATLWTQLSLPQMWLVLLYHLVTVHALWYAPIYGWLLLVSAWARRAPFLWAALPLLAIALVEKIAFNTSHFATMLGNRIGRRCGSCHHAGRQPDGSDDTPHSGSFPDQPGSVDRPGVDRRIPRRSGPVAPLSRTDLSRIAHRSSFSQKEKRAWARHRANLRHWHSLTMSAEVTACIETR